MRGVPVIAAEDVLEKTQDVQIAREWKWTLEYVRNLSVADYMAIVGVLDGEAKANKQRR